MSVSFINSGTTQATMNLKSTVNNSQSQQDKENQSVVSDTVDISEEGYALASQTTTETETDTSITASEESGTTGTGAAGGTASSSSSSTDETIEELEEQISELEKEIAKLAEKALTDEAAKQEMASKQSELSLLYSELAQLQQNQQQG